MVPSHQSRSRRAARWLVAGVGIVTFIGLVAIGIATRRALAVQEELDARIAVLQRGLDTWQYFVMRSQELATKQALVRAKVGAPTTTAADHELAPCLAMAAAADAISARPSGLEWNPLKVRRAIRMREAWCASAQQVIESGPDCAAGVALEPAIESVDRELAMLGAR